MKKEIIVGIATAAIIGVVGWLFNDFLNQKFYDARSGVEISTKLKQLEATVKDLKNAKGIHSGEDGKTIFSKVRITPVFTNKTPTKMVTAGQKAIATKVQTDGALVAFFVSGSGSTNKVGDVGVKINFAGKMLLRLKPLLISKVSILPSILL